MLSHFLAASECDHIHCVTLNSISENRKQKPDTIRFVHGRLCSVLSITGNVVSRVEKSTFMKSIFTIAVDF